MLGKSYEGQMGRIRETNAPEATKAKLVQDITQKAAAAYTQLIERYPVMGRADDARGRLKDLRFPVPTPTAEAIAQNKAEEASRSELTRLQRIKLNFYKRPYVASAAKVREPTLTDAKPTNATDIVKDVVRVVNGGSDPSTATVETIKNAPTTNEPPPHSDNNNSGPISFQPGPAASGSATANGAATTNSSVETTTVPNSKAAGPAPPPQGPDKTGNASAPLPPPTQVNDV